MDNFCIFLRQKGSWLLCLANHCEQFLFRVIFKALHIKPTLPFSVSSQPTPRHDVCLSDPLSFSLFLKRLYYSVLPFFHSFMFILLLFRHPTYLLLCLEKCNLISKSQLWSFLQPHQADGDDNESHRLLSLPPCQTPCSVSYVVLCGSRTTVVLVTGYRVTFPPGVLLTWSNHLGAETRTPSSVQS